MGDVVTLPQVRFAENRLIAATTIFSDLCQVPFSELMQMKLKARDTDLTAFEALDNIGICFRNMATQLQAWQDGTNPDKTPKHIE